jgi:hypothetical protein
MKRELKLRITSIADIEKRIIALGGTLIKEDVQEYTYFNQPEGHVIFSSLSCSSNRPKLACKVFRFWLRRTTIVAYTTKGHAVRVLLFWAFLTFIKI